MSGIYTRGGSSPEIVIEELSLLSKMHIAGELLTRWNAISESKPEHLAIREDGFALVSSKTYDEKTMDIDLIIAVLIERIAAVD